MPLPIGIVIGLVLTRLLPGLLIVPGLAALV